jgi:hypothetical protein
MTVKDKLSATATTINPRCGYLYYSEDLSLTLSPTTLEKGCTGLILEVETR